MWQGAAVMLVQSSVEDLVALVEAAGAAEEFEICLPELDDEIVALAESWIVLNTQGRS